MKGRPKRILRLSWRANPHGKPRAIVWYRTKLWADVGKLMGKKIPTETIVEIMSATGRYCTYMELRESELSAATVARTSKALQKSLIGFQSALRAAVTDEIQGPYFDSFITDKFSKEGQGQLDKLRIALSNQIRRCQTKEDVLETNPWDEWVVAVADSLANAGFKPTAFSYESLDDHRPPTPFVRLIALLQADLPEWLGQHEPSRAGHPWFSLSKAVVRVLKKSRHRKRRNDGRGD